MRRFVALGFLAVPCLTLSQTVRLQLKFAKDATQRVSSAMRMSMDMAAGQAVSMKMSQSQEATMKVVAVSPDGGGVVRMTMGDSTHSATMNGKPFNIPGADAGKGSKGASITMTYLPNGKITKMTGLADLIKKSSQDGPAGMPGGMTDDKSMTDMMNLTYGGVLPDHPVRVGDQWARDLSLSQASMNIRYHLISKLLRFETRQGHKIAIIGVTGTGSMAMSDVKAGSGQMGMKMDRLAMSAIEAFDVDRGWFSSMDLIMKTHGTMTMTMSGQDKSSAKPMSMGMDMKVTATYSPIRG